MAELEPLGTCRAGDAIATCAGHGWMFGELVPSPKDAARKVLRTAARRWRPDHARAGLGLATGRVAGGRCKRGMTGGHIKRLETVDVEPGVTPATPALRRPDHRPCPESTNHAIVAVVAAQASLRDNAARSFCGFFFLPACLVASHVLGPARGHLGTSLSACSRSELSAHLVPCLDDSFCLTRRSAGRASADQVLQLFLMLAACA